MMVENPAILGINFWRHGDMGGILVVQCGSWFHCMAHLFGGGQLDFHDSNCQSRQPTEANQKHTTFFRMTKTALQWTDQYSEPTSKLECQWMSLCFCSHNELSISKRLKNPRIFRWFHDFLQRTRLHCFLRRFNISVGCAPIQHDPVEIAPFCCHHFKSILISLIRLRWCRISNIKPRESNTYPALYHAV